MPLSKHPIDFYCFTYQFYTRCNHRFRTSHLNNPLFMAWYFERVLYGLDDWQFTATASFYVVLLWIGARFIRCRFFNHLYMSLGTTWPKMKLYKFNVIVILVERICAWYIYDILCLCIFILFIWFILHLRKYKYKFFGSSQRVYFVSCFLEVSHTRFPLTILEIGFLCKCNSLCC